MTDDVTLLWRCCLENGGILLFSVCDYCLNVNRKYRIVSVLLIHGNDGCFTVYDDMENGIVYYCAVYAVRGSVAIG